MLNYSTDPAAIAPDQIWVDADVRNTDRGKTGKAKPKYRTVKILSAPTLSMPGSFLIINAPKAPHTVGKIKKFTRQKLIQNYAKLSA